MAKGSERLVQVQQQRLQQRLNPQNVALGRLLEMSVPELEDEIRRELDDNPALEARENADNYNGMDFTESAEELQRADYADDDDVPVFISRASNRSADDPVYDASAIAPDDGDSMLDALMSRLENENNLSDSDRRIAEHIIGNLDDNGYLTRPLVLIADDIAMTEGFEPNAGDMRRVFSDIRALDPAGIGAVDLRDCLLLQLQRLKPSVQSRTAYEIIANNFDLFSKKHFDRLQSQLEISREALGDALDLIRSLNPKPASSLDIGHSSDKARHISPDLALDYDDETDRFTISLLGNIPELAIEKTFAADAHDTDESNMPQGATARMRQKEALAFIRRKRDDAASFIKLIEMRGSTLLTIARAIVELQRAFFISGDKADIKPMILRDVAAKTGLDLSVISRAAAGKYILTYHGIYPLKLFFNERPDADADVSSHEILKVISELIENEDHRSPLSDRELCEALMEKGYDIARRTVAKYRERLGLPVGRLRKQF